MCPPSPLPPPRLPVRCPCPFCSSGPAEAEKEKAGTGPAQTSGCRDLRLRSRAGHPQPWLGQRAQADVAGARELSRGGSPPPHSLCPHGGLTRVACPHIKAGEEWDPCPWGLAWSLDGVQLPKSVHGLAMTSGMEGTDSKLLTTPPRSAGATLQCTVRPSMWS